MSKYQKDLKKMNCFRFVKYSLLAANNIFNAFGLSRRARYWASECDAGWNG
jgi:hypothetical protein